MSIPAPQATVDKPYISVIVTAYRRRAFIREAVFSALNQTLPRSMYEVIILKDFPDEYIDKMPKVDPSISVLTEDIPRVGEMIARGLEMCRGEVICFLEDDDRFHEQKLERIKKAFKDNKSVVYLHHAANEINSRGDKISTPEALRENPPREICVDVSTAGWKELWSLIRYDADCGPSAMAFRTDVLMPWVSTLSEIEAMQDFVLFFLVLLATGSLLIEPSSLSDHRAYPSTSRPLLSKDRRFGMNKHVNELNRAVKAIGIMELVQNAARSNSIATYYLQYRSVRKRLEHYLSDSGSSFPFRDWLLGLRWSVRRGRPIRSVIWELSTSVLCLVHIGAPGIARDLEFGRLRRYAQLISGG